MKLSYPVFNEPIIFSENTVNVLVMENQEAFRNFIFDIKNQINGKKGNVVLSTDSDILNLSKTSDIITDLTDIDPNNKKVQTKLFSALCKNAVAEDMYTETNDFLSILGTYMEHLSDTLDSDISYSLFEDLTPLLKALNIKLDLEEDSICELMCKYIDTMSKYVKTDFFFIVNLKSFLTNDEYLYFCDFILKNKYNILLIESTVREKENFEKIKIIDNDLCDITY